MFTCFSIIDYGKGKLSYRSGLNFLNVFTKFCENESMDQNAGIVLHANSIVSQKRTNFELRYKQSRMKSFKEAYFKGVHAEGPSESTKDS